MLNKRITYKVKEIIATVFAICTTVCMAIPSYADTGVTVKVSGTDILNNYAVTGTYYNIGSSDKEQSVVKTDSNGKAYFPLPNNAYTNFDYTMMVAGFEITGTKEVAEIKSESKSIIDNDISWAVALGAFNNDTSDSTDADMVYNEIDTAESAQGVGENTTTKTDNIEVAGTNTGVNENQSAVVNIKISTDVETLLLREEVTLTLSGLKGSASFKTAISTIDNSVKVLLPDGTYNVRISETSNSLSFPSECTIVNGVGTLTATLKPISTLKVVNGTEKDGAYRVRSGNNDGTFNITQIVAVEPKRSYVVNLVDQHTKYNLMIPSVPNDYIFDFATGELTIDRPDKSAETIMGTEDNPFGIAETMDKGYANAQTEYAIMLFGVCVGLVCTVILFFVASLGMKRIVLTISKIRSKKTYKSKDSYTG